MLLCHFFFRYNTYVVVMAHWVIALWFIRCRYQHRMAVAKYITKVGQIRDASTSCLLLCALGFVVQSLSTLLSVSQEQASVRQRMGSFTHPTPSSAAPTPHAGEQLYDANSSLQLGILYRQGGFTLGTTNEA